MLCYVTRCYNKLLYMKLWCWGRGGDKCLSYTRCQISLRYFTFHLRYFNSSFRLNSCFSILYTLSPANELGNHLFYFLSLHPPPPLTLLSALLGSSHVNSHTLVHPKTRFGQYNERSRSNITDQNSEPNTFKKRKMDKFLILLFFDILFGLKIYHEYNKVQI